MPCNEIRIQELKALLEEMVKERPDSADSPVDYNRWYDEYKSIKEELEGLQRFEREVIHAQVENPDGSLMIVVFRSELEKEVFLRVHASEKARKIIERDDMKKNITRRKNVE